MSKPSKRDAETAAQGADAAPAAPDRHSGGIAVVGAVSAATWARARQASEWVVDVAPRTERRTMAGWDEWAARIRSGEVVR